jgi:signal transduction histidine kinase
LRQMIDNLLENAIKYTPPEGKVTVNAQVQEQQYILQVSDSGIGIPAADVAYIFEKFFRASNVTGEISGTGLGLAIVNSVVEANHGRIWVESSAGKGTTFTVMLPLALEDGSPAQ